MVQIPSPLTTSSLLTSYSASSLTTQLAVGQKLTVNVNQIQGQQVQLTIGNLTINAQSKQLLQQLGPVQVQVKQVQPTLELVIVPPNKPNQAQQNLQTLQSAYRQFIPNQAPVSQVFQQMSLLQSLPPSLQTPINNLLEQVLKPTTTLSGKELKQKLADSGLFLESKLASSKPQSLTNDTKAQLLKLQQQTLIEQAKTPNPTLAQLSSSLAQAINRLTVQQLQLYENPYIIPLELPIENKPLIEKATVEFRNKQDSNENLWEVYIDLTLPEGELSTKVSLKNEGELSCYLWCETPTLETLISNNLHLLKEQFENNDLLLKNLQMVPLKPPKNTETTKVALIDIHI